MNEEIWNLQNDQKETCFRSDGVLITEEENQLALSPDLEII